MSDEFKDRVEKLVDYIMKNCLWQFHSRKWDRERQNKEIIERTIQILCKENVNHESAFDKCYWVDAVCMAEDFKSRFPWIDSMNKDEIINLMNALKERMDVLTITGSLNLELTDPLY
jgi:nitrogenase delta subunit